MEQAEQKFLALEKQVQWLTTLVVAESFLLAMVFGLVLLLVPLH